MIGTGLSHMSMQYSMKVSVADGMISCAVGQGIVVHSDLILKSVLHVPRVQQSCVSR